MIVKTKRQLILEDFEKTLKELRETKKVFIDKHAVAMDFPDMPFDTYAVMSGTTTRVAGIIGNETYIWDVNLECYTKDEPEQKIKTVYNKLMEDKLRSNLVDDTILNTFDYWEIDEEEKVYGLLFTFTVIYNHPIGRM